MCIVGMPERNILTITYRECIVRWVTGDEKFQKLLSSIDTYFNIIWRYGCAKKPIVCIMPYFGLPYNFLIHKDV